LLSRDEKYIAHLLFRVRVRAGCDGHFSRLFSEILATREPGLQRLSLAACCGEGNGDVYLSKGNAYVTFDARALDACQPSFVRLAATVIHAAPGDRIRSLFVACNDRFEGTTPGLTAMMGALTEAHPAVYIDFFSLAELEAMFISLHDEETVRVIGEIPRPSTLARPEPAVITSLLDEIESQARSETVPTSEGLSARTRVLLDTAYRLLPEPRRHELAHCPTTAGRIAGLFARARALRPAGESDDWLVAYLLECLAARACEKRLASILAVVGAVLLGSRQTRTVARANTQIQSR